MYGEIKIITKKKAELAKAKLQQKLDSPPELVGVGLAITANGYAVSVHLSKPLPEGTIPDQEEDVPVQVEIVGEVLPY